MVAQSEASLNERHRATNRNADMRTSLVSEVETEILAGRRGEGRYFISFRKCLRVGTVIISFFFSTVSFSPYFCRLPCLPSVRKTNRRRPFHGRTITLQPSNEDIIIRSFDLGWLVTRGNSPKENLTFPPLTGGDSEGPSRCVQIFLSTIDVKQESYRLKV